MALSPMMKQYMEIKQANKEALLFFRLGDFYELFFDDALTASKELEITLTGRNCGLEERAPMCGVPFHSADAYIAKLIEKGYRVAICEQVEDASQSKGIVKREIVRIVSPGTVFESNILEEKKSNYLLSYYCEKNTYGIAYVDISTGEFYASEIKGNQSVLYDEISRISPTEFISNLSEDADENQVIHERHGIAYTRMPAWSFEYDNAYKKLTNQFDILNLNGFGCENDKALISAAGALLEYLSQTQKKAVANITSLKHYYPGHYMVLDSATSKNLEILSTIRSAKKEGSLLWLLDKTKTAMGGRLLIQWLKRPLVDVNGINERLACVGELVESPMFLDELTEQLKKIYDLERLIGRISNGNANARDLLSVKQTLSVLPTIKNILSEATSDAFVLIHETFDCLTEVYTLLDKSIDDHPPIGIKDGGIIKEEYHSLLDEFRTAMVEGKSWIAKIEAEQREKTGIKNLKIKYNRVFGYFLEVTNSNKHLVPDEYERKQTLSNAERYIIPALKEVENKILGAEEKSIQLEYELFLKIRNDVALQTKRIQAVAQQIAFLDVVASFAAVTKQYHYVKPLVSNNNEIRIVEGRHPVIEKMIGQEQFVSNDTYLDKDNHSFLIITGPNMAGKSTYMRQVALITLMAQIGCFVPAEKAEIGVVDRIFTRVGASDDLASGQSTFMVEMAEVSNIVHNATPNSLVILDEIGRGTSTYDGLSIAWAVVEHIRSNPKLQSKTLFSTHYHELTELEGKIPGVENYCIAVKEQDDRIVFLRKIIRGGAESSMGIQVAQLAGLPPSLIKRAKELLAMLEQADISNKNSQATESQTTHQVSLFDPAYIMDHEMNELLDKVDVNQTTPMQALTILAELIKLRRNR